MRDNIVGVRELRENLQIYVDEVGRGKSFVVLRKSKPLFKISPYDEDDELREEVIDFTKIRKGGVPAEEVLSKIKKLKNDLSELSILVAKRAK